MSQLSVCWQFRNIMFGLFPNLQLTDGGQSRPSTQPPPVPTCRSSRVLWIGDHFLLISSNIPQLRKAWAVMECSHLSGWRWPPFLQLEESFQEGIINSAVSARVKQTWGCLSCFHGCCVWTRLCGSATTRPLAKSGFLLGNSLYKHRLNVHFSPLYKVEDSILLLSIVSDHWCFWRHRW